MVILKVEWAEFVSHAMSSLAECHKGISSDAMPKFMKRYGYDKDSAAYDIPDYVEIELAGVPRADSSEKKEEV